MLRSLLGIHIGRPPFIGLLLVTDESFSDWEVNKMIFVGLLLVKLTQMRTELRAGGGTV